MWCVNAVYGAGLKMSETAAGTPDAAAGRDLLKNVQRRVKVMDKSGRESVTTFERGIGDALLTYENELLLRKLQGRALERAQGIEEHGGDILVIPLFTFLPLLIRQEWLFRKVTELFDSRLCGGRSDNAAPGYFTGWYFFLCILFIHSRYHSLFRSAVA